MCLVGEPGAGSLLAPDFQNSIREENYVCFIVDDKTINRALSFISQYADGAKRTIFSETGCNLDTDDGLTQVGRAMFALNCNAVEQRYGTGEAASFRDLDYEAMRLPTAKVDIVQAYKSLRCWLYQCSEGNVPESSLLYATMERVSADLAHAIVCDLSAYDRAEW